MSEDAKTRARALAVKALGEATERMDFLATYPRDGLLVWAEATTAAWRYVLDLIDADATPASAEQHPSSPAVTSDKQETER